MKEFKKGDYVKVIDPGCNYNYFPGSDLVTNHSRNVRKGDIFKIIDMDPDDDKYLGKLSSREFVSFNSEGLILYKKGKRETYPIY